LFFAGAFWSAVAEVVPNVFALKQLFGCQNFYRYENPGIFSCAPSFFSRGEFPVT
jgi:hypothetical protein